MNLIVLIVLILLLVGGIPQTGWHDYGRGPSGGVGIALLIVLILILTGRF